MDAIGQQCWTKADSMVPLSGTDSQTTGSLPPDRTDSRQQMIQLGAESPAHGGSFRAGAPPTGADIRPPRRSCHARVRR